MKPPSILLALTLVVPACLVAPDQGRVPVDATAPEPLPPAQPLPPPQPRPMSAQEAVARGEEWCRARGYQCLRPRTERLGNYWRIGFDAQSTQARGPLYLDFDATARMLVRADEPPALPAAPPPMPAPPPPAYAPAPPPYAPAPRPLSRDEAVSRAYGYCREHRFDCRLQAAVRQGDVWLVDLDARRNELAGGLHLGFDAFTGELLAADEPLPPAPRPIGPDEAANRGYQVCAERGWACRLVGSGLGGNVWRLDYDARRGDAFGRLHVELDAYSRAVLRVDEPRPPPPPAPRPMSYQEATARGLEVCAERGYQCRLLEAAFAGNVWRVDYDARRFQLGGRLHVELDAFSRAVLRLDELRAAPPPPPPPPPPSPAPSGPIGSEQAARIGQDWCLGHGYGCRVAGTELVRNGRVWQVRLEANEPRRGHVRLEIDAFTRAVIEAREEVRERGDRDRGERGDNGDRDRR